mgnify:FL=1
MRIGVIQASSQATKNQTYIIHGKAVKVVKSHIVYHTQSGCVNITLCSP